MKRILNIIIIILLSAICLTGTAQKIAVKSNLLGWATATPTLGAEIGLDDRWTLNTHIYYNPFTFRDNRKWKHIRVQPEVRYWLCQKFNGHFFGLHVLYTHFNAGQVPLPFGIFPDVKKYRYQGNTYGAGLSYGYQWILTPRWSIEGSIGVGYKYNTLEKSGYEAEITIDEPGARKLLKKESFDLVLSDVRLPEGDGISLLEWMRKERMDIPFIIMTGYASVPDAVQAIKLGAKDYLAKPVQMDELQRQLKDIFRPKSVICDKNKDLLPRNSLQMQEVEHLVSTVAPFDISVLILGPNGAGKESVAQRIHYIGERKDMPFVAVNCGVIPKELAPTLFFGHIKGTFTGADANKDGYFEMAKGGTLFLDEIGTLSLDVQAMLLRVLQEGTYIPIGGNKEKRANVRIVAATNEDLQLAIQEKRFREDLYHRLCEFEIVLPSLHECPDDILPLAHHFRKKFSGELKRPTEGFSSEAEQLLLSYRWPGNVRELHNRIRRAVLMAKQPLIETADLNIKLEAATDEINLFPENDAEEKHSIIQALKTSHGSRKQAAGILHIDPSTLYRKMKKYGLNDK